MCYDVDSLRLDTEALTLSKIALIRIGVCTALSSYTGSSLFDSFGSIAVGVLMGGVATFLIRMNRSFLIGNTLVVLMGIDVETVHVAEATPFVSCT